MLVRKNRWEGVGFALWVGWLWHGQRKVVGWLAGRRSAGHAVAAARFELVLLCLDWRAMRRVVGSRLTFCSGTSAGLESR